MDARNDDTKRAIVIAGPTASGKSGLAIAVAERLGGVIINADSMQVYADLSVLTARPGKADLARAPHRLFGHVDASVAYSVGRWIEEVGPVLEDTRKDGRVPIIVGGSGLYLKALLHGLSDIPAASPAVRERLRQMAEQATPADLHARLHARDPVMAARLRPSDPQRILRALEIVETTGLSLATFQGRRARALLDPDSVRGIVVVPERRLLAARIDARFDAMMREGGLDEAIRLGERMLDPALPAMRALGVGPLLAHTRGEMSLDQAVERSKLLTRQYAKRQMTFFRHQITGLMPVEDATVEAFFEAVGRSEKDQPDRVSPPTLG